MKEPNLKERVKRILNRKTLICVDDPGGDTKGLCWCPEGTNCLDSQVTDALLALVQEDRKEIVKRLRGAMLQYAIGRSTTAEGVAIQSMILDAFDLEAARVMEK